MTTRLDDPGALILTVEGAVPWWGQAWALLLACPVAVLGAAIALNSGAVPWIRRFGEPGAFLILAWGIAACAPIVAIAAWAARRTGRIEFYENIVVWRRVGTNVFARWKQLRGFRDDSIDFVQLIRVNDAIADPTFAIPTPTEKDRTAVLDLLARKGLRREE